MVERRSSDRPGRWIDAVLGALVVFDVALTVWAVAFPSLWFEAFHGVPYDDPQGFLRRCGANWAAFALVQAVARLRWKRQPHWLAVVAGVRLSDVFTDWTYLYVARDVTAFARGSLVLMSPGNLLLGLFFLGCYRKARRSGVGAVDRHAAAPGT